MPLCAAAADQGHNGRHAAAAQASETQRHAYYGGVGGVHVYTHSSAVQQKAGMVFTQVVASCTDAGTSCTAPRAILDVDATNDAAGANVAAHRTAAVDKTKTDGSAAVQGSR